MGTVIVVMLGIIMIKTLDLSEFMGGFDFEGLFVEGLIGFGLALGFLGFFRSCYGELGGEV